MMLNKNYNLYSFDIFDTLLTRKVARPTGIFVLMQHILNTDAFYNDIPNDVKTNFYQYRTDAEYYLRRINNLWHDGLDINFDAIYNYMQNTYYLSDNQIQKIKSLEISLELDSVVPIKENIDKIKNLLLQNKKVILISDMYLPPEVIKQILYNADPILSTLKLYLSSELRYMKKNGELFKFVKSQEDVEYKNWVHIGDNSNSDYSQPNKLGINVILYKYVDFEDYEKKLLKGGFHNPAVQLLLGCTKNLRLNKFKNNDKANLGASLAAPVLYPYISWLLNQSCSRSINRLYFIARDGYILKEITDTIIAQNKLNIKTFYTYGSRKAWRLSGLDINNEKLYKQFIDMFKYESKKIYSILNIDKDKLIEMLPSDLNQYYELKNRDKLIEYFTNNKQIIKEALSKNEQQRQNTLKYLKNNIDYSDEKFAFVDLDGSCLTQNCLSHLFDDFYNKPIKSFYYAVTPLCYEAVNLEKYYFSAFKKPMMGHLVELLTRAPHGQTLGYDSNGNPILEQVDEKALMKWNFEDYKRGILEFTLSLNEYAKQYNYISFETQKIMNFYLNYLFNSPDKKTASLLGELIHVSYGSENNEFAPELNIFEALKYLFTKKCKTENIRFSQARSHKLIRKIIEYKIKHPNLRKQIINVLINAKRKEANLTILGITISFRSLIWGKIK